MSLWQVVCHTVSNHFISAEKFNCLSTRLIPV